MILFKFSKIINDYEVNVNRMKSHKNPSNCACIPSHSLRKEIVRYCREDIIAKKITGRSVIFPLLRACTHPYLLDAPRDENGEIIVNDDLISSSGKFILLDKMLAKLGQTNHKVIVIFLHIKSNETFFLGFNLFNFSHFS